MIRDDDYLREFLFEIASGEDYLYHIDETFDEDPKRMFHVKLLCDAGYLFHETDTGYRLMPDGHDFIVAIRDNGIWEKTKKAVAETGGNATLEMIESLAAELRKKHISEHPGIKI